MTIIYNFKILNNINNLIIDDAINNSRLIWGTDGLYERSSVPLTIFHTPFGSISILYGPRQIGKTASLKLFLTTVKDSKTLLFTDCSIILNRNDLYQHLVESIDGKTTIVLDEVECVEGWHLSLRALYGEGKLSNCRVWCTGSEARYLIESGERLPGRKGAGKMVFARPWSFREYVDIFNSESNSEKVASLKSINIKEVNQTWLDRQTLDLNVEWKNYLHSGGIPKLLAEYKNNHEISDETMNVYRDWILGTWSKIRTSAPSLAALARRICETMNSRISMESLKKGTDINSLNTIRSLVEMQEDHFSLRCLNRMDYQTKKFLPAKQKKIYPIDPGIARVWAGIGHNVTRIIDESTPHYPLDECAFFSQMMRYCSEPEVAYLYSEKSQSEVDFYFNGCAFELKSNGNPTLKQRAILDEFEHRFIVRKDKLPIVAYLIGESRISDGMKPTREIPVARDFRPGPIRE